MSSRRISNKTTCTTPCWRQDTTHALGALRVKALVPTTRRRRAGQLRSRQLMRRKRRYHLHAARRSTTSATNPPSRLRRERLGAERSDRQRWGERPRFSPRRCWSCHQGRRGAAGAGLPGDWVFWARGLGVFGGVEADVSVGRRHSVLAGEGLNSLPRWKLGEFLG